MRSYAARFRATAVLLTAITVAGLTACGSAATGSGGLTLHLGYFANITHAPAIAGISQGYFAKDLGSNVTLTTQTYTSGGPEAQDLLDGTLDAAYIGPSSALSAFTKSNGKIVVVAGAVSGGAELVVNPHITTPAQLRGVTLATPQLGNTQDVALRYYLHQQGLATTTTGGGDVTITPQSNASTLASFDSGQIAGAWVPEPWASRLVVEGHGHVLVDERSLWPNSQFPSTVLAVSKAYLQANPTVVSNLIRGQLDAVAWMEANPAAAQAAVNSAIGKLTGSSLSATVISRAWGEQSFSDDPQTAAFATDAAHATTVGFPITSNLSGLFDVGPLNTLLAARDLPAIPTP